MSFAPSARWDLDVIFAGGPAGSPFATELAAVAAAAEALIAATDALTSADLVGLAAVLRDQLALGERMHQLGTYAGCAFAADTTSADAAQARGRVAEVGNRLDRADVPVRAMFAELDDTAFAALLADPTLADQVPLLRHRREDARRFTLRPTALQALATDLEREALHGWGQLYDHLSGTLEATVTLPGEAPKKMGIASIAGLRGHVDEPTRRAAFQGGNDGWRSIAEPCAMALTHLTGARQTRYDRLGVDELATSLHGNRVSIEILEAMFAAVAAAQPKLVAYLDRKARLLGKERLDWWDLAAPMPTDTRTITWDDAQVEVVAAFEGLDPDLAAFARDALARRWVDAEQRPGRMQGGFCASVPKSRQSRIFLTFSGTSDTVRILAHELGHAWHNHVLFDAPQAQRNVTMALAETASTFAEAVLRDAAIRGATTAEARAGLIDAQLEAGVAFLMNVPARFDFERRLFALRREGPLRADQLAAEMIACQKARYADRLGSYDDMFWASKLHFYISEFGFYNWPYTFGYLFSASCYARAQAEGPSFLPIWRELLRRTGYADTAAIGRDVLGEDLADPAFWTRATRGVLGDVDGFLEVTS